MAETQKEATPTLRTDSACFQLAEHTREVYCATAEAGHTFQQMLHPDYWSHVARKLKPYTMIECRSDDGTFWALALVLDCGRNWAKLHPLQYVPLTTKDVAQTSANDLSQSDYVIEWKGPAKKHVVYRKKDGAILQEGIQRKVDAESWLVDHLKTVAV